MQLFSFFVVGYSLGGISGWVRALNLTVPLGSGRTISGTGFSFEPVQTSRVDTNIVGAGGTGTRRLRAGAGLRKQSRTGLYSQ